MEAELMLTQSLFWYFVIVGGSLIWKHEFYEKVIRSMVKEQWMFFGGFLALLLGFVILGIYNTWSWEPMVLVTIVGWISILKGVISFYAPEWTAQKVLFYEKKLGKKSLIIAGLLTWVFAALFGYLSFVA